MRKGDTILKKLVISVHCHKINIHIRVAYHVVNLQMLFIVVNETVLLLCVERPVRFMLSPKSLSQNFNNTSLPTGLSFVQRLLYL